MIAHISGEVITKQEKYVVVDVSGVGYKLHVSPSVLEHTKTGERISLWTHLVVKEDALDLYGFTEEKEVAFFEMLIGISGVGPKSALGIMGVAPLETLKAAIAAGDTSYLTKVSGIGKKNAEKIVLELKDKLGGISYETTQGAMKEESDVVEALEALGYSTAEAREALKHVPDTVEGASAKIKEALKHLGGNQ